MIADWIKEWAIPLSAGATFLLALAAFWAIWQNKRIQKRNRRERLLNEIIEWATNVAKCGIEPDTPELSEDKDASKAWPFLATQERKLETLQLLRAKSVSVTRTAQKIGSDLQAAVFDSVEHLRNQIKSLYEYKRFTQEFKDKKRGTDIDFLTTTAKEVITNNKLLYNSAVKVIEEAIKIKTRDIS